MDLSKIPTAVLQAEHEAIDAMHSAEEFGEDTAPICSSRRCGDCPLFSVDCDALDDGAPGWSERKEQYLLRIRAALAERGHPISPNSSEGVSAK